MTPCLAARRKPERAVNLPADTDLHRPGHHEPVERDVSRRRHVLRIGPTLLAYAVIALGLLNIVSAVTPEQHARLNALRQVVPLSLAHAASATTAVAGLLLMMLGHGLRRRKRRAWRAAVVLLALSVALHLVKGLDGEEAAVALV